MLIMNVRFRPLHNTDQGPSSNPLAEQLLANKFRTLSITALIIVFSTVIPIVKSTILFLTLVIFYVARNSRLRPANDVNCLKN
jgi:hypothetical protein